MTTKKALKKNKKLIAKLIAQDHKRKSSQKLLTKIVKRLIFTLKPRFVKEKSFAISATKKLKRKKLNKRVINKSIKFSDDFIFQISRRTAFDEEDVTKTSKKKRKQRKKTFKDIYFESDYVNKADLERQTQLNIQIIDEFHDIQLTDEQNNQSNAEKKQEKKLKKQKQKRFNIVFMINDSESSQMSS